MSYSDAASLHHSAAVSTLHSAVDLRHTNPGKVLCLLELNTVEWSNSALLSLRVFHSSLGAVSDLSFLYYHSTELIVEILLVLKYSLLPMLHVC